MNTMQKIVPSLWFDQDTEEAVNFYIDIFNGSPHKAGDSKLISLTRYEKGMDVPGADHMEGKVLTAILSSMGRGSWPWMGVRSSSSLKPCRSMWSAKTKPRSTTSGTGSRPLQRPSNAAGSRTSLACLGKSFPSNWESSWAAPNRQKSLAATNAMLKMKKIVIADLQSAFDQA
jgi:predicted 3-demethylubiquinone-9 3-methyltransferase (glyoxalase superfamily)